MKSLHRLVLSVATVALFIAPALAQNAGTVTNHAFVLGKGAGTTGYSSLLCTSAQLAVGQTAADPICRTLTGDVTIDAAGATTVTSTFLNAIHTWGAAQTLTINQNAGTNWIISNNSAGVAAAAAFNAGNGTGTAGFGIGGTGYTSFSSVLQNRSYVYSSPTAAGIAVFADGANPINFYNNGTLSGAFSSAGVFSLTTPLAAGSGGTGINSIGAGCATWLGTPSSANLRTCLTDESGTGAAYFQGGDIGTPSAGVATNITSLNATQLTTGTIPAARTNGHQNGTATNDSAAAGEVGELTEATLVAGSATSMTTATAKDIITVSLTAGDWDLSGVGYFIPSTTADPKNWSVSLSSTLNTQDVTPGRYGQWAGAAQVDSSQIHKSISVGPYRISLSGTTTLRLVGLTTFSTSTMSAYGYIRARRAR